MKQVRCGFKNVFAEVYYTQYSINVMVFVKNTGLGLNILLEEVSCVVKLFELGEGEITYKIGILLSISNYNLLKLFIYQYYVYFIYNMSKYNI